MATITDPGFPTLMNWAKRLDPSGGVARIVNVLEKRMPVLQHMPFMEGNLTTGHRITRTSGSLPAASWRKLNAGVSPVKADTDQYDETCGLMECESVVDEALAALNGNGAAYRQSEDDLIAEGMAQQFATALFYESVADNPERIHGLSVRYPATTGYDTSSYTLRGGSAAQSGGSADNRSVWLIDWAPRKIYGIFPKGTMAGLTKIDKGLDRITDPNDSTKHLYAWITQFKWYVGLAVEDYRYAVRCQWDPSDTTTFSATSKALVMSMQDMLNTIFDTNGNLHFYMDRTSKKRFDYELANSGTANLLEWIDMGGRRVQTFMGVPIHVDDTLVAESYIA